MKKRLVTSLVIGTILSAAACYLAFRNVPLNQLVSYLKAIDYALVAAAMAIGLAAFFLRIVRWQLILSTSAKVKFMAAFHPLMIGFMMNCILPGRVGEVARPVILTKQSGVPFTSGLATVLAERLFDAIFLLIFFAVLLGTVRIDPGFDVAYGGYHLTAEILESVSRGFLRLTAVLLAAIVAVSIPEVRRFLEGLLLKLPLLVFFGSDKLKEQVAQKISAPLVKILQNIAAGLGLVRQPYKLAFCLVLSFLIWFLSAVAIWVMSLGAPGIGLSFMEMAAVMIIICLFIALPSVPGFWGLWEAGGIFALTLFGVSSGEAAGFTLVNHAAQLFPVIVVGLISAIVTGVHFWKASYGQG